MISTQVVEFMKLGPLPSEDNAVPEQIDQVQAALERIEKPLSQQEANALVSFFGDDGCFGLAWTLLHLIETAPNCPSLEGVPENEWTQRILERRRRGAA